MQIAAQGKDEAGDTRNDPVRTMMPPRLLCIALAIALVSTIISLSASAAEAQRPGEAAYDSPEAAFAAVFLASGLGERAYHENREYAAAIYEMPDGRWYSTAVVAGDRTQSAIPYHAVPQAALRIVGAHTHGQPHIPEDDHHVYGLDFSQVDLRNGVSNFRSTHGRISAQLLLTSDLKILRLRLSGQPGMVLGLVSAPTKQEILLAPGDVRGTTELLGQLPVPTDALSGQRPPLGPVETQVSREASALIPMSPESPGPMGTLAGRAP